MSQAQLFRAFVHNKLSVAFVEIFELFEKMISACEEDGVPRSEAASEGKRRLLATVLRREELDAMLKREELKRLLDAMLGWDEINTTHDDPLLETEEEQQENELALLPLLGSEEEEAISEFTELPAVKSEDAVEEPLSDFHQYQILENGETVPLLCTSSSPGCTSSSPPLLEMEDGDNSSVPPDIHLESDMARYVEPFVVPSSPSSEMVFGLALEETSDGDMQTFGDSIAFTAPLGLCNKGLEPPSQDPPSQTPPSQTPTPYQCKACWRFLCNKVGLVQHVKTHPRECGLCGKRLEPTDSIKLHLQTHKQCNDCGTTFSTYSEYDRHVMGNGERERPFACADCGKRYTTAYLRKRCQQSHTKPFRCSSCGKGFGQRTTMEVHMRSHTGEKPYGPCAVCGKRFSASGSLVKHLRVHSGERRYGCTVCEKRLINGAHLKIHMKIHC